MADSAPVGAGSAPLPLPPAPDGILTVRGGLGGISFQFEELLRGVAQLDQLVRQLLAVEAETRRVQDELALSLYESYASGCEAINAVADSGKEVGRVRHELEAVAEAVRAGHRDYQKAETRNAYPGDFGAEQIGLSMWAGTLSRDITENLLSSAFPSGVDASDAVRSILGSPFLRGIHPRSVTAHSMGDSVEVIEPSMAQSMRRLESLHALGDGQIEIIQLDKNGSSAWMVLIPGTQPNSPNTNPFDIPGIGEALGYDSQHVAPAIAQALREAGAEAGDQVVAVGHSQGGAHAMNLSRNKAFLSEFDLKYVLTAGAPTGGITPEQGISSMHLEHAQDWVPGGDGRLPADTKDRVTVTLTNPVQTPEGQDPGLGPGHDLENYASGAERVSASEDPSLVASSAVFAGVVGAGGAAKVTRFKLEREPIRDPRTDARAPNLPENRSTAGAR
ncbi:hypothetical protein AB0N65_16710 [Paenarthrobacter sp. NPDC089322]|uniref:hypothetical protein n=1 Tax=Paenarthrobacter sp. NPDC089322 TaxID=3155065 RepID=UPI0034383FE9